MKSHFNILLFLPLFVCLYSCGDPGPIEEAEPGRRVGQKDTFKANEYLNDKEINLIKDNCQNLSKVHNDAGILYAGSEKYSFDYKYYFKACDVRSEEELKDTLNLKVVRFSDSAYRFTALNANEKYYNKNVETDRNGHFKHYCSQVKYNGKPNEEEDEEVEDEKVQRYVKTSTDRAIKIESTPCEVSARNICFKFYELEKVQNSTGENYNIISESIYEFENDDIRTKGFLKYFSNYNREDCDEEDMKEVERLKLKFIKFNN